MITERRSIRKVLSNHGIQEDQIELIADEIIAVVDETRPRQKVTETDASAIFRSVTGMAAIPPVYAGEAIDVILALAREYGKDEARERLDKAWKWWNNQKRKDNGLSYSKLNGNWINYAITNEFPDIQKANNSSYRKPAAEY